MRRIYPVVVVALLSPLLLPNGLPAQDTQELRRQAEQLLGRPLSDQEILRLIRETGLTSDEIRNRLEREGFARGAADPYLSVLEGRASAVPQDTDPMPLLRILVELEEVAGREEAGRQVGRMVSERPSAAAVRPEALGPPIFGRDLFRRATSQFAPVTTGPVPPDYRLGPEDELVLVLTGGVEQAYRLTVSREGWIVIPDVGRILVNGLTLEALEEALYNRLSEVYSGIERGPEATTFFDVSLGKLRTNQVYVIGEVEEPAAYQVSSLATALTALYWAGGPNVNGSFREIAVNRGGRTVAEIDLYDYLLRGQAEQDVRLEQGDVVFVPVAGRRVQVDGAVQRPGIYEVTEGEGLRDLIRFAGGTQATADLRHVQIQRILPPAERTPGRDRAVIDIPLDAPEGGGEFIALRDGDRVTVFAVLADTRNRVTISGGVWRPGSYGAEPGMRLWDLIERAGGLLPDAYEGRAQIQRLQPDYTRRMIPVSLRGGPGGEPLDNPEIEGMDQVFVYAQRDLREERVVSIGGWVRQPGVYPYVDGMTVRDLMLQAGGVRTGVFLGYAEVSRVVISQAHTDTLTRRFQVPLDSSYVFSGAAGERRSGSAEGGPAGDASGRAEFVLQNLDALYIRKSPGFEPQQAVIVSGQVMLPGPYSLETRTERLTELVERAGGLTPEAYAEGLQLWRAEPAAETDTLTAAEIAGRRLGAPSAEELQRLEAVEIVGRRLGELSAEERQQLQAAEIAGRRLGALSAEERQRLEAAGEIRERPRPARAEVRRTRVGVGFVRAMRRPAGPDNVLIEPNDSIFVPRYISTVQVRGAVGVETKVLYRQGAGFGYYVDQAGGYAKNADKSRTRVRYANGEVRTRGGKFLFFGGGVPDPDPGSTIPVPAKPEDKGGGFRVTELVAILTSVMTAAATVIIATQ